VLIHGIPSSPGCGATSCPRSGRWWPAARTTPGSPGSRRRCIWACRRQGGAAALAWQGQSNRRLDLQRVHAGSVTWGATGHQRSPLVLRCTDLRQAGIYAMLDAVQILWSPAGVTLSSLDSLEPVDVTDGDTPQHPPAGPPAVGRHPRGDRPYRPTGPGHRPGVCAAEWIGQGRAPISRPWPRFCCPGWPPGGPAACTGAGPGGLGVRQAAVPGASGPTDRSKRMAGRRRRWGRDAPEVKAMEWPNSPAVPCSLRRRSIHAADAPGRMP
jgi:hypothetical protein